MHLLQEIYRNMQKKFLFLAWNYNESQKLLIKFKKIYKEKYTIGYKSAPYL